MNRRNFIYNCSASLFLPKIIKTNWRRKAVSAEFSMLDVKALVKLIRRINAPYKRADLGLVSLQSFESGPYFPLDLKY
tara:strand:+ start:39102 stop:39335 length:234 start_codon:yes stop_codon:yes gene_type:complete